MCIKCAIGMSNESVKGQLENVIETKFFNKINTTGIQFILYTCVGIFGNESKQVGLELIKMFIEWLKNKEVPYFPETDFEEMYHYNILTDLAEWCENSDFVVSNDNEEENGDKDGDKDGNKDGDKDGNKDGDKDGDKDGGEEKRMKLYHLLVRKMNDLMNPN